jgi:hypothetical protein
MTLAPPFATHKGRLLGGTLWGIFLGYPCDAFLGRVITAVDQQGISCGLH